MTSEIVIVNCYANSRSKIMCNALLKCLSHYKEYDLTRLSDGDICVDLTVGNQNVRLRITRHYSKEMRLHVCLIGYPMNLSDDFIDDVKVYLPLCKVGVPGSPIIIACYSEKKFHSDLERDANVKGKVLMNRNIGEKLATEVGAVKYVEFLFENGRGAKILVDEIVYAGLNKIKEKKEGLKLCIIQ